MRNEMLAPFHILLLYAYASYVYVYKIYHIGKNISVRPMYLQRI